MSQHWATGQGRFRRVVTRVKGCLYTRSQTFHQIFPQPRVQASCRIRQEAIPDAIAITCTQRAHFHKFKALQHHDIMRQLIVDSQTDKTSPTRCVALVWKGLRLACTIGASKCSSARLKAGNNFRNDSAKARFVPMTTFSLIFLAVDCATACEASTCRTIRVTTLACASPCRGTSPRQRH